jgi:protein-disulfide isomerase
MVETKKSSNVKQTKDTLSKSDKDLGIKKSLKSVKKTKKTDILSKSNKGTGILNSSKKVEIKTSKDISSEKDLKNSDSLKVEIKKTNKTNKQKVPESKLWKISSAVLVIIVLFLAVVIGLRFLTGHMDNNNFEDNLDKKVGGLNNPTTGDIVTGATNSQNDGLYGLLIIEDSSCTNCNVDYFTEQIKTNLIPELSIEKIEYTSDVGKVVIDNLGIKIAPVFLFTKSIDKRDDWEKLANVLIPVEISGTNYYLLNPLVLDSKVLIENPIQTTTAITIGNEDAKVTLVEFSDFECPVCALMKGSPKLSEEFKAQSQDFIPTIPKIMEEYVETGKVKYIFYNFPIDRIHPSARAAHNAALCANEQDAFKAYSDELYNQRETWVDSNNTNEVLINFAEELNLDKSQFKTCLSEQKYNSQIEEEMELAMPYGVGRTPTYFVNKQIISGLTNYETFSSIIDAELEKVNK